jgi:carbon monoxide dehydrogenase subunit G
VAGFARSIDIAVPPEVAFEYLADPTTATVIDPMIVHYRPDHVPMRVGTTVDIKVRTGLLRLSMASVVVAWEPARRMVFRSTAPARPISVVAEHRFEPDPAGTRYTWSVAVIRNAWGGGPAARLVSALMSRNAARQQQRLKAVLERSSRGREAGSSG